jgi:thymidylate synthase (FAD)
MDSIPPLVKVTVPNLDAILGTPLPVLDHGFVRVVDYMGSDESIVQAARVSYGKGTKKTQEDTGLIRYLMRHRHSTPFEMCEIKLHVKLPIFIARQWIRHRTANVNEYSARYSVLDKEFYIPPIEAMGAQSTENKQGRAQDSLSLEEATEIQNLFISHSLQSYEHYESMLAEPVPGIARELARITLPVNFYTQMYWKIDLHNLFHFLSLRASDHAQQEIRAYAETILEIVKIWVPIAYEAFSDYRLHGAALSGPALDWIRSTLKNTSLPGKISGLSPREIKELSNLLKLPVQKE